MNLDKGVMKMSIATMDLSKDSFVHAKGTFYVFARNGEAYQEKINAFTSGFSTDLLSGESGDMAAFGLDLPTIRQYFGENLIIATGGRRTTDLQGWTAGEDEAFPYDVAIIREIDIILATKDNTPFGADAPLFSNFLYRYFMHTAKAGGTFRLVMRVKDEVEEVYFADSAVQTCEETPEEQTKRHVEGLYSSMQSLDGFLRAILQDD